MHEIGYENLSVAFDDGEIALYCIGSDKPATRAKPQRDKAAVGEYG